MIIIMMIIIIIIIITVSAFKQSALQSARLPHKTIHTHHFP